MKKSNKKKGKGKVKEEKQKEAIFFIYSGSIFSSRFMGFFSSLPCKIGLSSAAASTVSLNSLPPRMGTRN